MNTTTTNQPKGLRRVLASAATSIALALSMALGLAGAPASASTYLKTTGSPGGVATRTADGLGLRVGSSAFPVPSIRVNGPTVSRSQAWSGDQLVQMTAQYEFWTGSAWANGWSSTQWLVLPRGLQSNMFSATDFRQLSGNYRIKLAFAWYNSATNAQLGTSFVLLNHASDYRCLVSGNVNNAARCTLGNGWITVW